MESGPGAVAPRELQPHDPTRVGPYALEAKIGEGGMGAVYLGRGTDGRPVAVKVVRPELAGDRAFVARFNDECRNAERVASFCTAQVLGHGQDMDLAYMVTEYIEGPSLLQHIQEQGTLSQGLLDGVAVGVAAALVAIHAAGLVHRDLKPSNVLLSISGPRVIDFGIARALDAAGSHTATGQVVGTPGYIAPEQILTQKLTPAVDVFAWGCLVAYAANGRNPFGEGSLQIMVGRALHADPELGALSEPLAGIVRAALRKEPEDRPTSRDLLLSLVGGAASDVDVTTTLGESWTNPPEPQPVRSESPQPAAYAGGPSHTVPLEAQRAGADGSHGAEAPRQPTDPAGRTITDPGVHGPSAALPPPMPPPHMGPLHGAGPQGMEPPKARRKRLLVGGAMFAVGGLLAGGVLLAVLGDDPPADSGAQVKEAGPPTEAMLVRIDTKAGWPNECHGDIGTYTPGQDAPVTLVPGDTCDVLPERSPTDPSKVAFVRRKGNGAEAWTVGADGRDPRPVAGALMAGGRLTWSPDGRQLAFMGKEGGSAVAQIYALTIGEPEPRRLTQDASVKDDPMWSSRGELVFWSRRDGVEQLYKLDPRNTGRPWTKLSTEPVRAVDPEWSPDGRQIAYSRGNNSAGNIWVMNADGSGNRKLTPGGDHEMDPAWSKDGTWLCYVRGLAAKPALRVIKADGTGDRAFGPKNGTIGHPTCS
ncbi:protein kinase [Actinomadura sp. 9N407]|uniref:protein kinase domain-containing protein n=1 Tax=Actinomadura sp. 9N407 TaxID=3375154 RepID=UPI0037A4093F